MSDVAQLMRAANPVPDSETALTDDEFDALLLLTQSRSGNVDVQELTKPLEPEKKQRSGWLVAAAAFAVVIVFVGAAMLLSSPADELPPATTPPTTEAAPPTTQAVVEESAPTKVASAVVDEEAVAYLEALAAELNAGDYEAAGARVLAASDFRAPTSNDPRTFIAGMYHYWTEMDSTVEITECRTSPASRTTRCILSRTSEFEPFHPEPETSVMAIRIDDGAIAFFSQSPERSDPWWPIYVEFQEWAHLAHPDDHSGLDNLSAAPEAAALMKEYAAEWRATLDG